MKEIIKKIRSDYHRYTGKGDVPFIRILLYLFFSRNHGFNFSFWLRLSSKLNIFWPIAFIMYKKLSHKYNIDIPRQCNIGYGLHLGNHFMCMVINYQTIIGNNVNLNHFLTIGTNNNTPAVIGDNIYIGPNVCIIENVHIGNGACVGAGSVVVKDVPRNSTVAGVPAKVISYKSHKFINNRYETKEYN